MPLSSDMETWVLLVSTSNRVTVAPGTTAPEVSVTVPRSEARNCACATGAEKAIQIRKRNVRTAAVERLMNSPRHAPGAFGQSPGFFQPGTDYQDHLLKL